MSASASRTGTGSGVLTGAQRASWDERGFFRVRGFAAPDACAAMLPRCERRLPRDRRPRQGRLGARAHGPGDLLVVDSHLMHGSTDNETDGIRAAMVYHDVAAGTVDHTEEYLEYFPSVDDWVPARRGGRPTAPRAA